MRTDISDYLVHWTKGGSYEEAAYILLKIIFDDCIKGGRGFIKGRYICVCFTEAPIDIFHNIDGKYKPFGVQFSKSDIFNLGGRHVIYQTEEELKLLPDEIKWRHVRYDLRPHEEYQDFTWEREWRLLTNSLALCHLYDNDIEIVVPNSDWECWLVDRWNEREEWRCQMEALALGGSYPMYGPEEFPYKIIIVR